jgi:hypothetical protein
MSYTYNLEHHSSRVVYYGPRKSLTLIYDVCGTGVAYNDRHL